MDLTSHLNSSEKKKNNTSRPAPAFAPTVEAVAAQSQSQELETLGDDNSSVVLGSPVSDEVLDANKVKARELAEYMGTLEVNSSEVSSIVRDIRTIGNDVAEDTMNTTSRFLSKSEAELSGGLKSFKAVTKKADNEADVANQLSDLRLLMEEMRPTEKNMKGKILGFIPFGQDIRSYVARFESRQKHVQAIYNSLEESRQDLVLDVVAIESEQFILRNKGTKYNQLLSFTVELKKEVERVINDPETDERLAQHLNVKVLPEVNRKISDLQTALALAFQQFLTLNVAAETSDSLCSAIESTKNVAIPALMNAAKTAQLLDSQKRAADQVTATRDTTERMMIDNSELLKQNAETVYRLSNDSAVSIDAISKSLDAALEAQNSIDRARIDMNEKIGARLDEMKKMLASKNYEGVTNSLPSREVTGE